MRFSPGKSLSSLVVTLVVLTLAFGCGGAAPGDDGSDDAQVSDETTSSEQSSAGFPITVTDSLGREVTIEENPQNIASIAPSVTETIFAIGAGDKVVGVTTADLYPEEVTEIEKVGDFQQVNVEKLLELDTDLLFLSFDSTSEERADELEEQTGAPVVVVNPKTMEEVLESMSLVGEAVGEPERGQELEEEMRADLAEIQEAVAGEPEPTVFYELYGDPLQTVGPGSFIDDEIVLAGGENIAADTKEGYPTYSEETIIEKDPDYYLVGSLSGQTPETIAERPGFADLTAVIEGNVVVIDDDLVSRPGPRIVAGVREIAESVHPNAFDSGEETTN